MSNAKKTNLFPYLERLLDGEKVEWKTLGEVAEYVRQRVAVDQLCAQTYVGVDNLLPNRAGKQDSNYTPTEGNAIAYQPNDILIGNIRPYLKKIWKADNEGGASADVLVVRITNSLLTPGYLYHLLADDRFFSYDMQHAKGAKMPRGDKEKILDYVLPIPPLRVQARIVEILDKFTQLEAELEAELEARRKQYAYYRDQLLNFSQYPPPLNVNIEWKTLGEVCHIVGRIGFRGYTRNDIVERGEGAISISPTNIVNQNLNLSAEKNTYISWEKYNESPEIMIRIGDVVLAKTASVGKAALVRELKEKATINPQMVVLKEISCLPAYLVYYICTPNFQLRLKSLSGQGSVPNISQAKLKTIPIPFPPLSEQRRIVDILDRFDTLTNSISEGLPKEIALRRKQYAYYRDALLSFPRPEVSA